MLLFDIWQGLLVKSLVIIMLFSCYSLVEDSTPNGLKWGIFKIYKTSNISILDIPGMVFNEVVFLILLS